MIEIDKEVGLRRFQAHERAALFHHLLGQSGLEELVKEKEVLLSDYLVKEIFPGLIDPDIYQIWLKSPRLFETQSGVVINLKDVGLLEDNDPYYPNSMVGSEKLIYEPGLYRYIQSSIHVTLHHKFPAFLKDRNSHVKFNKLEEEVLVTLQQLIIDFLNAAFDQINFRCHERTTHSPVSWDWKEGYGFLRNNGVNNLSQLLKYDENLFLWFCNDYGRIDYKVKSPQPEENNTGPNDEVIKKLKNLRKILED